jgi:hypothetical protein
MKKLFVCISTDGFGSKFWYALPQTVLGPPWQSPPPVSILQPPFFEQGCG